MSMKSLARYTHPDFGSVRTVMIEGEPWFVAVDICRILDIENTSQAVSRLDKDETQVIDFHALFSNEVIVGNKDLRIVSESGLFALVMRSRKAEARPFQKWVTGEVLPSIRKTGSLRHPFLEGRTEIRI